jgi:hypothetical protein
MLIPRPLRRGKAAAAAPVGARLDREHHALLDLAGSGLVGVRRLMGAGAHAVRDRMGRLARVARLGQSVADQAVEVGEARAGAAVVDRPVVDIDEEPLELGVPRGELARAEVLGVVAPVAVGADPDLEQGRLVLLYRQVAGGRERLDPRARPDEREAERELDLALPAGARAVDEPVPDRADLGLLHAGTQ